MQAVERIDANNYWITIILVLLLLAIFFLKATDAVKLKGYAFSLFSKNFIEDEVEENTRFFTTFTSILFLFSITVLSLLVYSVVLLFKVDFTEGFTSFSLIFLGVFAYYTVKKMLEYLLSILFLIKNQVRFYLVSKWSYLYSSSFYVCIVLVLVEYSQLSTAFLIYFSIALFVIRFLVQFSNNKNLIFNKLFYFILYICAFEIAPLFILFKLMF